MTKALTAQINVVINYSGEFAVPNNALRDACEAINNYNIGHPNGPQAILCAAAGNSGINPPFYPGNYSVDFPDCVVCAGASTPNDTRSDFSNFGDGLTVLAPGSDILSTIIGSSYGTMSGTSMATPVVTGIISLIWSNDNSLSAAQAIAILKMRAVKLEVGKDHDPQWGYGIATALWDNSYFPVQLSIQSGESGPGINAQQLNINLINN